jgi:CheY-like chemotaxis protein
MSTTNTGRKKAAPIGSKIQDPPGPAPLVEDGLPGSRREWVLAVDDSQLMRIMLRRALERAGFQVVLATSGHEAIELYRQYRSAIGAVLLDVQMPDVDGPGTLAALRDMDPGVRVCFVSGNSGEYLPEDLVRRGADVVFFKPYRLADLADVVRRMVNGEPAIGYDDVGAELRAAAVFAAAPESPAAKARSGAPPA